MSYSVYLRRSLSRRLQRRGLFFLNSLREGADGGEGAVALVHIEAVADDIAIGDGETDPAGGDGADPLPFFVEQYADFHPPGAELFGVVAGVGEGQAGIEDVVDEENIAAAEISPYRVPAPLEDATAKRDVAIGVQSCLAVGI